MNRNGRSGCPQYTPGKVPSATRRVAAHCLEMARTTVAHPQNRLQMARAARRSRAAGVICNSWAIAREVDAAVDYAFELTLGDTAEIIV